MVYRKSALKKRATKGKRRIIRRRRVNRRKTYQTPEYASLSCKRTLVPTGGGNFTTNNLFNLMNTQLVDFQRAVQVAQAYQHYRIKSIKLTFKPSFDTFQAGNMSKMNLYYMIDKSGSLPQNVTLEGLKQMGARPFSLDEKPRTITWRPSVLDSSMYAVAGGGPVAQASPAKYHISPWLSTNSNIGSAGPFVASGVDHLGIYWYNEQLITPVAQPYQVDLEVQFQFKKPLTQSVEGAVSAIPAVTAELNASPDGVVGGGDNN